MREIDVEDAFRTMIFRDSRDQRGALTFLSGNARKDAIRHMPLIDVITGELLTVADLV